MLMSMPRIRAMRKLLATAMLLSRGLSITRHQRVATSAGPQGGDNGSSHVGTPLEQAIGSQVQDLAAQVRRLSLVTRYVAHITHHIYRMIRPHLPPRFLVIAANEVVQQVFVDNKLPFRCRSTKDLPVFVLLGVRNQYLVAQPTQIGFINKIGRTKVRGEDQQEVKWQLDGFAGTERKVVYSSVHRTDPTIKHVRWGDPLAAEVVDYEDSSVGLHLRR